MKRLFDIILALVFLSILLVPGLTVALLIIFSSGLPVFFLQKRVGKGEGEFRLIKFRSMHSGAEGGSAITVGGRDPRITSIGYVIRKYKIDEWPQLINVLRGDMSFVGPRPEVPTYVQGYSEDQRRVFEVRPGITDLASIKYRDENELLAGVEDPDRYYRQVILPDKLRMGVEYVDQRSLGMDLRIMWRTFLSIF